MRSRERILKAVRSFPSESKMSMKRKALEGGDDNGRYKPQNAALQNAEPKYEIARGRRHAAYLRKLRALNAQFAAWIAKKTPQVKDHPWAADAEDYLKHLEGIQTEFRDVLEAQGKAGLLLMFGTGDMCQLGFGDEVQEKKRPSRLSVGGAALTKIAAGGMHTLALTTDGQLWTWGVSDEGGLGRPVKSSNDHITDGEPAPADAIPDGLPGLVPGLPRVVSITAGDSHSACITDAGDVWAWGAFRDAGGLWAFQPGIKMQRSPVKVLERSGTRSFIQAGALPG
ncbi:hypothetical protein CYMTET_53140 [Cymbomonas tetramitiformis]|uniref:Uncharacterized protein n=1 Tax=Cymbomonas tetramitiformis TaxID=36881 RepID=A0AAE0EQC4_9CHLO|nr:hypothetical protein CYMTET_53140 [Cymbomonas tetramitiformis]